MAQYGYQGGGFPASGYSQAGQYQNNTSGMTSGPDYSPPAGYNTAGHHLNPGYNQGMQGMQGTGIPNDSAYDSMSPAPSSGTMSNATPGFVSGNHMQPTGGYPGVQAGSKGHSMSPSPVTNDDFRWWIPSEGISRAVLLRNIQHFLGPDAIYRQGPGRKGSKDDGVPGYWIRAERNLTRGMIEDLQEETRKDEKKNKRPRHDYDDRERDRDRDPRRYDRDGYPDARDSRRDPRDRDVRDPRRDPRDPKYKGSGITPPPPGRQGRDNRYSAEGSERFGGRDGDYLPPQQPYGGANYQGGDQYQPYPPNSQYPPQHQPPYGTPGYPNQNPAFPYGTQPSAVPPHTAAHPGYGHQGAQGNFPPGGYPNQGQGYQHNASAQPGYGGQASGGFSNSAPPGYYLASDGQYYPLSQQ